MLGTILRWSPASISEQSSSARLLFLIFIPTLRTLWMCLHIGNTFGSWTILISMKSLSGRWGITGIWVRGPSRSWSKASSICMMDWCGLSLCSRTGTSTWLKKWIGESTSTPRGTCQLQIFIHENCRTTRTETAGGRTPWRVRTTSRSCRWRRTRQSRMSSNSRCWW